MNTVGDGARSKFEIKMDGSPGDGVLAVRVTSHQQYTLQQDPPKLPLRPDPEMAKFCDFYPDVFWAIFIRIYLRLPCRAIFIRIRDQAFSET